MKLTINTNCLELAIKSSRSRILIKRSNFLNRMRSDLRDFKIVKKVDDVLEKIVVNQRLKKLVGLKFNINSQSEILQAKTFGDKSSKLAVKSDFEETSSLVWDVVFPLLFKKTAKRPIKFSSLTSFDKLWQKYYERLYRSQIKSIPNRFYNKITRNFEKNRSGGFALKKRNLLINRGYQPLGDLTLLGFLINVFKLPYRFAVYLITKKLIFLNNSLVTNPFIKYAVGDIVKFNMDFTEMLIFFKLYSISGKSPINWLFNKTAFKQAFNYSNVEYSFKLNECLWLSDYYQVGAPNANNCYSYRTFPNITLTQRYFVKQKRFGLGRLL